MAVGTAACVLDPALLNVLGALQQGTAGIGPEMIAVAIQVAVMLWAVRDATVRTQQRPFLSLISPALSLQPSRVLAGAAAWAAAAAMSTLVLTLVGWIGGDHTPPPTLHAPSGEWWLAVLLGLLVVPLQASTEELLFRGWLTQTLGQFIRPQWILAVIVALAFALVHLGPGGVAFAVAYFMIGSLGLSAISLADQRLELAIGAHTAQNLFVLMIATPILEGGSPTLFGSTAHADIGLMALAGIALQNVLLFLVCRWWGRPRASA